MHTTRQLATTMFAFILLAIGALNTSAPGQVVGGSAPTAGDTPDARNNRWAFLERFISVLPEAKDERRATPDANLGTATLDRWITALRQLNLTPAFTLGTDQREKIMAIRTEWQVAYARYRAGVEDEALKWFNDYQKAVGAQKDLAELRQRHAAIAAKAPRVELYTTRIKAVLTAAQADALVARINENEASAPPPDIFSVQDTESGMTISAIGGRRLCASKGNGDFTWQTNVDEPVFNLRIEKGVIRAFQGKGRYTDFDLQTGKMLRSGSN